MATKERPSLLNLAAKVLAEAGEPLNCQQMVEKVLATGRWNSEGKTPAATLASAIIREIARKGEQARFRKIGRGQFVAIAR
ncbi:MAG: winged helix-turn-helix domain-containing protein [Planctomycetes bacterium]|nr:winged helix-turn-helix domain-containing protein [Planctomycetota bacterium]